MTSIFANNIKILCERYGLSNNELARRSGIPQPTISRTLTSKSTPRDATVRALAKALNVDPWALRTQPIVDGETGVVRTLAQGDLTTAEERRAAICPATPSCHVEPYPDKPRLEPDAPAVGVVALDNGGRALVLGTPSVSLGRITLKTASGQSVPVDRIVAYVEGWAVFRRHRQP